MVWKKNCLIRKWQKLKINLGQNKKIFDAKIWGIFEAFKVAKQKIRQVQEHLVIIIFFDF